MFVSIRYKKNYFKMNFLKQMEKVLNEFFYWVYRRQQIWIYWMLGHMTTRFGENMGSCESIYFDSNF